VKAALAGVLVLWAGATVAQVAVNPSALNGLRENHAPAHPVRRAPARRAPVHPVPARREAAPPPIAPAAPVVPPAPPAKPELPPVIAVPTQRPEPMPVIPMAADAPGGAETIPEGLRVTFGPGRADLNPASVAAIRAYAAPFETPNGGTVNVVAYAAGPADDPSTARRLSLDRGLAVRAVLLNAGVVSTRIYVRALGTPPAGELAGASQDRVDLMAAK